MLASSSAASWASNGSGIFLRRVVTSARGDLRSCSSKARREDPPALAQPGPALSEAQPAALSANLCVEPLLPSAPEPWPDSPPGPPRARGAPTPAAAADAAALSAPCARCADGRPRFGGLPRSTSASSLGRCCFAPTCSLCATWRCKLRSYSARRVGSPKVSKAWRTTWNTSAAPPLSGCVASAWRRYAEHTSPSPACGPMPSTS
mmetsp:Transcript_84251/g.272352  ORF Transcript_84251/g.272352 Transcript_84251/m.272352 type:complete len:205 (-) Transcript_84251:58-672(-)